VTNDLTLRQGFTFGDNDLPGKQYPLQDPKRPNWTFGGAPQAPQTARPAYQMPVQKALAEEARMVRSGAGKVAHGAGKLAAKAAPLAMKGLGLAAGADVLSNFNDFKIDDPEVDSSAAGTIRSLRDGNFAQAGRSLSKGALEAGMDLGSNVASAVDIVSPGTKEKYGQFLRGQFGDQLIDNRAQPVPESASAGANGLGREPFSDARFASGLPPPAPTPENNVTRVGSAFSGSNIRDGYSTNGKGASNMNSAPGFGFDAALEQRTAEARQGAVAAQKVLDGYGPGPNGGGVGGFNTSSKVTAVNEDAFNASRRQYLLEQGLNSRNKGVRDASARGLAEGDPAAGVQAGERIAGLRERGEMSRNTAMISTQRDIARDNNAVSLRGQDVQLQGQRSTARLAQQSAEREQGNKDRTHQLDVAKVGKEMADTNLAQRTSRENQIQKNIEARAVGPDGTPDPAAAAEYRRGLDRSVARLGLDGAHALSPKDEQRLMDGSDLLKTMRANAGMLPWKPDQLSTVDPVDLTNLRVLPNGDRQITRKDSRAAGQIIPRRFFDTEEGVRYFGGTKTNRYDMLSEGAQ